jgi:hypothetical protein
MFGDTTAIWAAQAKPSGKLLPVPITVQLARGSLDVLDDDERSYVEQLAADYAREHQFTSVSDLQDLDRLITFELLHYRYGRQLSSGKDSNNEEIYGDQVRKAIREASESISKIKERMRLDPASRAKDAGDTVAQRWANLTQRAGKFGVHRLNQARTAIALFNELHSLCATWQRATDKERRKLGLSPEQIVEWVLTVASPIMDRVDAEFRENHQALWQRGA